jgi:DNA-binding transcriptional regulator YbjK
MKQRQKVKAAALKMVKAAGLINLSRRELCASAGIPDGSFPHVMGCTFAAFVDELRLEDVDPPWKCVSKTRANPALRKDNILDAAVRLARVTGYNKITRDKIAESAGVSTGLVTRYFGTMSQLKTAIMRRAVKQRIAQIVAQGLANGDEHAKRAPAELKAEAAAILSNY